MSQGDSATLLTYPRAIYARSDDPGRHWYEIARAARRNAQGQKGSALVRSTRGVSKRGVVDAFSSKSRRRLMRTLAAVRWDALPAAPSFVTLTFHRVPEDWRARWLAWLACARRSQVRYVWRLELQDRGAPHWHVIVWAAPRQLDELRADWDRIAANGSRAHRRYGWHVKRLDSYRKCAAYVSKYVAKVDGAEAELTGCRRWAASRDLPVAPLNAARLDPRAFHQLSRLARRMARARRRERKSKAHWWRLSVWLFVSPEDSARILAWIGGTSGPATMGEAMAASVSAGILSSRCWRAPPLPAPSRADRGALPLVLNGSVVPRACVDAGSQLEIRFTAGPSRASRSSASKGSAHST